MRPTLRLLAVLLALPLSLSSLPLSAQQKVDEEYTKKIKEYLRDPRITTELVDHLPASSTVPDAAQVPRPHRRHAGRADLREGHPPLLPGPRQGLRPASGTWTIGKTEEGRDMIMLAIADEATIRAAQALQGRRSRPRPTRGRPPRREAQQLITTGQADLLAHQRHALARERRARDADGAGLPPGRRGDAVHPAASATTSSPSSPR